ncbi:epidermal growth factor receptor-like isoform X2 [Pomacea canaliculata]|uniref:epidermal growth factor receptor-like isoform X2 n=1 Tax=Pomacea canaliculata TaxID=400727 RepID=UPI000D73664B|nr:epidermal growth factor receptor-like isoform X2 [Pomacea canaliculata]
MGSSKGVYVIVFLTLEVVAVLVNGRSLECAEGLYGIRCEKRCSPGCRGGCNQTTGRCLQGCDEGWTGDNCIEPCPDHLYGPNCVHPCGHCLGDVPCAPSSGICTTGCEAGLYGPRCDKVCEHYYYGAGCTKRCGRCRLLQPCNAATGLCSGGCEAGWYGTHCDQACSNMTYGVDCTRKCGMCAENSTCNHMTGICDGGCRPGWTGPSCTDRCAAGKFGEDCAKTCGRCLTGACDHVTGICTDGCARGWRGEFCLEECQDGTFGTNCSSECGHCLNNTTCDIINGICSQGCEPGWRGVYCNKECAAGFYGADCQYPCGRCKDKTSCVPTSGLCPEGCQDAWTGPQCGQAAVSDTSPIDIHSMLPALVVVTVIVVLLMGGGGFYFFIIRPRSNPAGLNRLYTEGPDCGDSIRNTYEQMAGGPWDLPRTSLILTNQQLGNGQFGQVKKGFVRMRGTKIPVAIKSLKENASEKDKRDFLNELTILKQVGKHPNVVCLVGACHIQGVMYVAMEYAKHGDLRTFLRKSRKLRQHDYGNCGASPFVSKTMLLRFALNTSQGLRHLADKQIIHRDVAARNVLLGDHLVAKIADFGLSKNDETYVKTSSTRVPIRWMAVESLFNNTYTTQSDVWSFGVVLWEIFTLGGTPYSSTDTQQLFNLLKDGYRLKRPRLCDQNAYAMMLQCWNEIPERRPTFPELCGRLQRMLEDCQVYMNISTEEESLYAEIDHERTS